MDRERYVEEDQVLHPGRYRRERYNDTTGAVHETTRYDAAGNAFTRNHQLGPAERHGYDYVRGDAPQAPRVSAAQRWSRPATAAAGAVGGAAAFDEIADHHVQHTPSGKDDGTGCLIVLAIVVVVALGPVFLGVARS
ncbi:hypothetical protein ACWDV7_20885 [Streptomyces sp. NPDC003362]